MNIGEKIVIELLTNKTLKYIVRKNVIDGNDKDILDFYKYGIEISISSMLNVIIVLTISLICNSIIEGLLFLLVFIPTRQYTGGYHAETYFACNLVFGSSYFITLILCKILSRHITFYNSLLFLILEIVFVLICCPVKNKHKPINDKKSKLKYKIIGVSFFVFFGMIGLNLLNVNKLYSCLILFALHLIVVMGIAGVLKEGRELDEKE